jgi:exonuclease V gamma subunit
MLRPPSEPRAVLETLVEGYLEARRRPLPFFPSTSEKCAKTFAKTGDEEAALQHARSEFSPRQGDDFSAESERDAAVLAFRGQDPLETHRDEFLNWAKRIWADDWTEDEGEEGS